MVTMFFTRAAIQRKECMDNGGLSLLEDGATGNSVLLPPTVRSVGPTRITVT